MANAYTINDHNLVINVRSDFLTYGRAIGRFAHACREKNQKKHIKYLNKNPATINRYKLLSEFNNNGNMRDANAKDDELHNIAFVKNLLKCFQESFEKDYTNQSYTQKRKGIETLINKSWRKDMAGFCEIIITFGTDRKKEPKEGLNDEESKFINENIHMDRVMRFINTYCAKYGVKCLLIAEHNDEKTKHYQIIFTNYNFEKHANLRFSGKAQTAEFGKELQDMGAEAFEGQVLRGKPSKNRHKNLTQMHQIASEYKSEQELKEKIQKLIEAEANKHMQKKEPLWGDEYFRLEPNEKRALIVGLRNSVFEQLQENITITSDEKLKEQVEFLTGQIIEQNKIIEEDREKSIEVLKEKEQLEKELDDLKETKAEQDKEIMLLKNRLEAHINQQTKIYKQNTLIESKNRENQSLTRKTESLQKENIRLRDLNGKSLGILIEIANINPEIREIIVNEIPELRGKFTKDDAGMEMG
ncbi:coiled-coil domain-containing protein [Campylobacter curvus]|uniref:hypothetical protein n=1 Tax=Campylobacter curvus TaxID=200 RepID=UPI0003776053|nr:hypothetical protein [Campylobacter curvus]QKF62101.1 hypothetical protein CCVT_1855 [Campylobacter curvus]UEB50388.1 hypothetical protein LK426_02715 [Campylobacter curvus]